jgi:hypothetical protein
MIAIRSKRVTTASVTSMVNQLQRDALTSVGSAPSLIGVPQLLQMTALSFTSCPQWRQNISSLSWSFVSLLIGRLTDYQASISDAGNGFHVSGSNW